MLAAAAADIIKPIKSITNRASQRILIVILLSRPDAATLAGLSAWSLAYITMTVAPIRARL